MEHNLSLSPLDSLLLDSFNASLHLINLSISRDCLSWDDFKIWDVLPNNFRESRLEMIGYDLVSAYNQDPINTIKWDYLPLEVQQRLFDQKSIEIMELNYLLGISISNVLKKLNFDTCLSIMSLEKNFAPFLETFFFSLIQTARNQTINDPLKANGELLIFKNVRSSTTELPTSTSTRTTSTIRTTTSTETRTVSTRPKPFTTTTQKRMSTPSKNNRF